MAETLQRELERAVDGEVRFDKVSRALYSTDASVYQIEPLGVVIPRSAEAVVRAVEIAGRHGVPITPRGGGTSQAGQSIGAGIVLEALMVFFLVWTIVATAVNPEGTKEWAPLAIATSLALGVLLIGSFTGAALNPARAFGPDLTNWLFGDGFGSVKDFFLVYLIAPIAAGILAATVYSSVYIKGQSPEGEPEPEPPAPSEASPS